MWGNVLYILDTSGPLGMIARILLAIVIVIVTTVIRIKYHKIIITKAKWRLKHLFEFDGRKKHQIVNKLWPLHKDKETVIAANFSLARHHVIPGTMLIKFFDILLEDCRLPALRDMLQDLLQNAMKKASKMGLNPNDELKNAQFVIDRLNSNFWKKEERELIVDKEGIEIVQSLFYFRPDNCFIGPRSRLCDPKSKKKYDSDIDIEARFIVPHFHLIHHFYEAILNFFENRDEDSLKKVFGFHRRLINTTDDMIQYCPEDWMKVSQSDEEWFKSIHDMSMYPEQIKKWKANKSEMYEQALNIQNKFEKCVDIELHKQTELLAYATTDSERRRLTLDITAEYLKRFTFHSTQFGKESLPSIFEFHKDIVDHIVVPYGPESLEHDLITFYEAIEEARKGETDSGVENMFESWVERTWCDVGNGIELAQAMYDIFKENQAECMSSTKPTKHHEEKEIVSRKAVETYLKRDIKSIITFYSTARFKDMCMSCLYKRAIGNFLDSFLELYLFKMYDISD